MVEVNKNTIESLHSREFFANCDKKLQGSAHDSKLSISFDGKQSFAEQIQFKNWLLLDVARLDV